MVNPLWDPLDLQLLVALTDFSGAPLNPIIGPILYWIVEVLTIHCIIKNVEPFIPHTLRNEIQLNPMLLCRAFRALLFLTPEDVATFPGLGSTLPYSTALHLLISR